MAAQPTSTNPLANYWLNGQLVMPGAPPQTTPTPAPPPQNSWGPNGFQMPQGVLDAVQNGVRPPGTLNSGVNLSGGNTVSTANEQPAPKVTESGFKKAGFGGPNGEDPSLYVTLKNGSSLTDWASQGGPSLSAQLSPKSVHGTAFDPLGLAQIFGYDAKKKATNAQDQWGTPNSNAGQADAYDYAGYVNSTGLKDAYTKYTTDTSAQGQKNLNFIKASYDENGDGQVSPGEFGQWWAEQTPDGQAAVKNGDFKPVTSGLSGQTTPTLDQLQAQRAAGQGASSGAAGQNGDVVSGVLQALQQPPAASPGPNDPRYDPEVLKQLRAALGGSSSGLQP